MSLLGLRCAHTIIHGPFFRGCKHDSPLFKGQLAALFIQGSKLIKQVLAAAKADIATQVGRNWVLALIQHMQEGQRGFQAQTGPGRVVANSWSRGGTVDTGNYVGHCCSPSQWPMS